MKIDKIEYKRVINNAGHLEYDLLQFLEKNRDSAAAQELKQSEIDYLLSEDIQHRIIQKARKSLFGDSIIIKDSAVEDYLLLKKYTDIFQLSL
ncbi:hypothetical protein A5886_002124 [Enterococcus sp. 8G7_MSG3316]|uniref:Uncharacterized protein n=1 Tax=Candidatus Enterococcus testudinis TaxID=1834191 RepID=A0A242A7P2_9ENTE|nr:hypothetical protein [Enterococcus sp. 8G7_MSG3316]OTN77044.1 hypothetical protein A5886_002124 [Enterococcus sp. 8G7_MSG3316]